MAIKILFRRVIYISKSFGETNWFEWMKWRGHEWRTISTQFFCTRLSLIVRCQKCIFEISIKCENKLSRIFEFQDRIVINCVKGKRCRKYLSHLEHKVQGIRNTQGIGLHGGGGGGLKWIIKVSHFILIGSYNET
jgi:hypothetical protein